MYPTLFEIPGLNRPISAFGATFALAFLVGSWLWARLAGRFGDDPENDPERTSRISVWILVGVMAGARLLYVVVEIGRWIGAGRPEGYAGARYVSNPLQILAIWEGGLVMYGALAGGIALGSWCAHRVGMRPLRGLDTALVAAFVGHAIGRVGCILVGDDYGAFVPEAYQHLPFPITLHVPPVDELHPDSLFLTADPPVAGQVIWATQAWMSANALLLAGVGYWLLRRRRYGGQVTWWLLFLYGIGRYVIEDFRGDGIRGVWFDGAITTSQLIALASGLFALAMLVKNRGRQDPDLRAA